VLRNLKRFNLFTAYRDDFELIEKDDKEIKKDGPFRTLIRQTLALPLLPKHEAGLAWNKYLKPKLLSYDSDDRTKDFVNYFDHQWMTLAPQLWNFYRMDRRGTNAAEAYHSTLQR
jgi:hypothetical protein